MAVQPEIRVEGLKELQKALKQLEGAAPRELREANKAAAELVAARARERGQETRTNLKGNQTRLGSRGVASIRAKATQTGAAVVMGGPGIPYAFGHEWGARRYRQFPPSSKQGYILYPSVQELKPEIIEVYQKLLDELIGKHLRG